MVENKEIDEYIASFPEEVQQKYIEEIPTTTFISYGATMRGYILIPEHICSDTDQLAGYLDESYDYVLTLEPK